MYNIGRKREREEIKMAYYMEKAKKMTNDELKDSLFILNMVDRWTNDDWNKYHTYILELASRRNK